MKIAFTGDSTSGQFYPIIAMAEEVFEEAEKRHIVTPKLFFLSDSEYNPGLLFNNQITFIKISNINLKEGSSISFATYISKLYSIVKSFFLLFSLFPDVIVSKGGEVSFPILAAAKILGIPIFIHETNTLPNEVNKWSGRFATRIAVSYQNAAEFFPKEKTAYTGQPIRKEIRFPLSDGGREYLHLEKDVPTLLVLGGTDEGQSINDTIVNSLPLLLDRYQVIHQTGKNEIASIREVANVVLNENPYKTRYHAFSYLDDLAIRMAAGTASIAISQAGSVMFELASWGVPAIVIPVTHTKDDHQRKNAFAYARLGGAEVIEEVNLTPHLLVSEIDRLMEHPKLLEEMKQGAKAFAKSDATEKIANGILDIALTHEL